MRSTSRCLSCAPSYYLTSSSLHSQRLLDVVLVLGGSKFSSKTSCKSVEGREIITLINLLAMLLFTQLSVYHSKGTPLTHVPSVVRQDLHVLLCKAASRPADPQHILLWVRSSSPGQGSVLPLCLRLLSPHFSSLSRFLWIAVHDLTLELSKGVLYATVQVIKLLPINKTNEISPQDNNGYSTRPNLVHSISISSYLTFI